MNKNILIFVCIVIIIAGFNIWKNTRAHLPITQKQEIPRTSSSTDQSISEKEKSKPGVITNQGKTSTYTNNEYKFSFSYPNTWNVGDNSLGTGTFQLIKYSPELETSGVTRKEPDNIEVTIIEYLPAFFGQHFKADDVVIAGQPAYKVPGAYAIELPSDPTKNIGFAIYGDESNYYQLDAILKSLKWIK